MKQLDDELRDALRREEPPVGFAERVLAAAAAGERPNAGMSGPAPLAERWRIAGWMAAAAVIALVAGGIQYQAVENAREERARGEAAKEQVIQALRITGHKLQVVQAKVKEIGS